jgi:aminoglycoside phosphotransferase (APT) family kinase protein
VSEAEGHPEGSADPVGEPQQAATELPVGELRRAPSRRELATLVKRVAPGGRVVRTRRLKGGISSGMHAVDVADHNGSLLRLVVRRYNRYWQDEDPGVASREWAALTVLERHGVPAPRPVLLDADGSILGTIAIVTTLVPGRGLLAPRDRSAWLSGLASALLAVHAIPASAPGLQVLPLRGEGARRELADPERRRALGAHPDGARALAALGDDPVPPPPREEARVMVHGDFWPGNTLWHRGRLSGIVDWELAGVGDPDADVAYCRLDLALSIGADAAEGFLDAYQARARSTVTPRAVARWELINALRALPDPAGWLPGWHELGLSDLTPELVRVRLRSFIDDAVGRLG